MRLRRGYFGRVSDDGSRMGRRGRHGGRELIEL